MNEETGSIVQHAYGLEDPAPLNRPHKIISSLGKVLQQWYADISKWEVPKNYGSIFKDHLNQGNQAPAVSHRIKQYWAKAKHHAEAVLTEIIREYHERLYTQAFQLLSGLDPSPQEVWELIPAISREELLHTQSSTTQFGPFLVASMNRSSRPVEVFSPCGDRPLYQFGQSLEKPLILVGNHPTLDVEVPNAGAVISGNVHCVYNMHGGTCVLSGRAEHIYSENPGVVSISNGSFGSWTGTRVIDARANRVLVFGSNRLAISQARMARMKALSDLVKEIAKEMPSDFHSKQGLDHLVQAAQKRLTHQYRDRVRQLIKKSYC